MTSALVYSYVILRDEDLYGLDGPPSRQRGLRKFLKREADRATASADQRDRLSVRTSTKSSGIANT